MMSCAIARQSVTHQQVDVNAYDKDMSSMFSGASISNQSIDSWDVSSVTGTSSMFNDSQVGVCPAHKDPGVDVVTWRPTDAQASNTKEQTVGEEAAARAAAVVADCTGVNIELGTHEPATRNEVALRMVTGALCERRSVGFPDPDAIMGSSSTSSIEQGDIEGCLCGDTCSIVEVQQGLHEDFVTTEPCTTSAKVNSTKSGILNKSCDDQNDTGLPSNLHYVLQLRGGGDSLFTGKRKRRKRQAAKAKEEPRTMTRLKLVSEDSPFADRWKYPLCDERRRSFAGHLQKAVPESMASKLLASALEGEWLQPEGRWGPIPRKTVWMVRHPCQCQYRYVGASMKPVPFAPWVEEAFKLCMHLRGLNDPKDWPDSCNLNLYEGGGQAVGWHADDEHLFQGKFQDCRIIPLSLGDTRRFELKSRDKPLKSCTMVLGHGDVCTMEGMMQKHYLHRVPKTRKEVGFGVNLIWRWIKHHSQACPTKKSGRTKSRSNYYNIEAESASSSRRSLNGVRGVLDSSSVPFTGLAYPKHHSSDLVSLTYYHLEEFRYSIDGPVSFNDSSSPGPWKKAIPRTQPMYNRVCRDPQDSLRLVFRNIRIDYHAHKADHGLIDVVGNVRRCAHITIMEIYGGYQVGIELSWRTGGDPIGRVQGGHHHGRDCPVQAAHQDIRFVCIDVRKICWATVGNIVCQGFAWPFEAKKCKSIVRTLFTNHCRWADIIVVRGRCFTNQPGRFSSNRILENLLWHWRATGRPYLVYKEGCASTGGGDPVPKWLVESDCYCSDFCQCNLVSHGGAWHHPGQLFSNVAALNSAFDRSNSNCLFRCDCDRSQVRTRMPPRQLQQEQQEPGHLRQFVHSISSSTRVSAKGACGVPSLSIPQQGLAKGPWMIGSTPQNGSE